MDTRENLMIIFKVPRTTHRVRIIDELFHKHPRITILTRALSNGKISYNFCEFFNDAPKK